MILNMLISCSQVLEGKKKEIEGEAGEPKTISLFTRLSPGRVVTPSPSRSICMEVAAAISRHETGRLRRHSGLGLAHVQGVRGPHQPPREQGDREAPHVQVQVLEYERQGQRPTPRLLDRLNAHHGSASISHLPPGIPRHSETRYASIDTLAKVFVENRGFIILFLYTCRALLTQLDL